MTTQEKIEQLNQIAQEIRNFKGIDIAKNCTHVVPGEGNPDTEILFIGEAPGRDEDLSGRPFVGLSGRLLRKTITETLGKKPEEVFITNIVKYRPPDNRDPTPEEIEVCKDWLDRQIEIISPKIIVTLGRFSMAKFIPDVTISRVHGIPRKCQMSNAKWSNIVFPLYHPAAALRAGIMMKAFLADFIKLKDMLNSN